MFNFLEDFPSKVKMIKFLQTNGLLLLIKFMLLNHQSRFWATSNINYLMLNLNTDGYLLEQISQKIDLKFQEQYLNKKSHLLINYFRAKTIAVDMLLNACWTFIKWCYTSVRLDLNGRNCQKMWIISFKTCQLKRRAKNIFKKLQNIVRLCKKIDTLNWKNQIEYF